MPGEPLTLSSTGLAGKLPAHGDFVRRGDRLRSGAIDRWMEAALGLQPPGDRGGLSERIAAMPPWRFAAVGDDAVLIGAMVAGWDKVGRAYPLVGFAVVPATTVAAADGWCAAAETALIAARDDGATADALAQALAAIPIGSLSGSDPPGTGWWRVVDGVRSEGPRSCPPDAADFAWLLDGRAAVISGAADAGGDAT